MWILGNVAEKAASLQHLELTLAIGFFWVTLQGANWFYSYAPRYNPFYPGNVQLPFHYSYTLDQIHDRRYTKRSLPRQGPKTKVGTEIWGFPKIRGTLLGIPTKRTLVHWGLYWGSLVLGNFHVEARCRVHP